jgi:Beta-propeller repeat
MPGARRVSFAIAGVGIVTLLTAASVTGQTAARRAPAAAAMPSAGVARAIAANAGLPLGFVENRGQTDSRVRYYAQGNRYAFYVTRDEVMLALAKKETTSQLALALRFVNRNPLSVLSGAQRAPGKVNYLRGKDPARWRTQLARYRDVVYHELWPGIDLRLHQQGSVLKYEFRVRPGGRVSDIRLAYAGATGLALGNSGALRIKTALGVLRDSAPVSYQEISGVRVPVRSRYALGKRKARFAFAVGGYRRDHDLIIDPGIQYTTFLGGADVETGAGIAVDGAGNAYVAGTTQSPEFPTTPGAFQRTGAVNAFSEVFVSKLNPTGTALVYSTFVGGSDLDFGLGIAIDAAGNAYVTGRTKSSNFPTTAGAFSRSLHIPANCPRCVVDNTDGFAFKLNAAGSALTYSTYLGGTDYDSPRGIAVDGAGNAYVTGETLSGDFPTTPGSFRPTSSGSYDMFVTKLNPGGTGLVYSTFLGGTQVDDGARIAVDGGGNAYALGFTSSTDFPTTPAAFDTTANGGFDVSLTKLNPAGSGLVYSTYLGGQGFDTGGSVAVDAGGNAYVTGGTGSVDFPTTPGAFDTVSDGNDAFVTKLNAAGSVAVYSTVVGGTAFDGLNGVVLDTAGDAWLTGSTDSADYPVTADAADASFNGSSDVVISELNAAGSALLYSTYLGGPQSEAGLDIARDAAGNLYVAGQALGMDFPATVGAFDSVFNGGGDAFVTKLAIGTSTSTPPAPPPVPAAPALLAPANADTPAQPIGFDWSDATGAASYTIQIAGSSAFSPPLVRNDSVTASFSIIGGLASTTQFWRVRGVNSAGVAGAWSAVRSFTPQAAPPPTALSTLQINPTTVVGGNASSGTIIVSVPAPDTTVIALSSSNPAAAAVPASVTVPTGGFTGTYTIATSAVAANTAVVITASLNGSTRTGTLMVTSSSNPPPPSLQSVAVSPASVTGASGSQGIITLSGGAPGTGAAVSLQSSNPAVAAVPATSTVSAGASISVFSISTSSVSTSTTVTISATYNGVTQTASLTVTPTAAPPPPPQTATLTVTATGRSGERVTSSPAGISIATGSSSSASFAVGTAITLSSSRSAVWSGACSSGGSKVKSCTFTFAGTSTAIANVQ